MFSIARENPSYNAWGLSASGVFPTCHPIGHSGGNEGAPVYLPKFDDGVLFGG